MAPWTGKTRTFSFSSPAIAQHVAFYQSHWVLLCSSEQTESPPPTGPADESLTIRPFSRPFPRPSLRPLPQHLGVCLADHRI